MLRSTPRIPSHIEIQEIIEEVKSINRDPVYIISNSYQILKVKRLIYIEGKMSSVQFQSKVGPARGKYFETEQKAKIFV